MNIDKEISWKNFPHNSEKISELSRTLSINSKIISVLLNRGMDTAEKISVFLNGGLEHLHNPFLFPDMQKAADRIRKAIDSKERILVYGDRDVDGITAVNIIVNTIKLLGGNIQWYVPADEGYGIHKDILTKHASENVKILITVDCGISAFDEVNYAKSLGIDVILTDHHEPPYEGIPEAFAVINPKVSNSPYPFKDIAGCMVSLKLAQAVMATFAKDYNKDILLCFCENKDNGFSGFTVKIKNDIETERKTFGNAEEIKKDLKSSYKTYTNNAAFRDSMIKNDALLKDKIEVVTLYGFSGLDSPEDVFLRSYKFKKIKNDGRMNEFFAANLDLCALGTIADSMPLTDENRIAVKHGLKIIASNPNARPGLGLLIEDTLISRNIQYINSRSISWNVTPVLNSSGRMGRGMLSAQLLMTKDSFQAKNLYADIIKLNENRRWLQSENVERFKVLFKEQCDLEKDKVIVIKASNLEHGVTGIVASQVVKNYSKPAFLLITDGKEAVGAARSVDGFDLIASLESVKDILVKYGGHSQAAGFTVEHSKIDEFKKRIKEYADKNLADYDPCENITIDCELKISDICMDFYNQLDVLEPFGMANIRPIFCIKGVSATEISLFGGNDEHIKFKISQKGSRNVQAVFWNHGEYANMLRNENLLDIAFHLDVIGRNEKQIAQLCVVDIKPAY